MELRIKHYSEAIFHVLQELFGTEDIVNFNRFHAELVAKNISVGVRDNAGINARTFSDTWFDVMNEVPAHITEENSDFLGTLNYCAEVLTDNSIPNTASIMSMGRSLLVCILSGSRAEGFDFQTSDYDIMWKAAFINVIQNPILDNHKESSLTLLMERENTRPGFVRLRSPCFPGPLKELFTWHKHGYYLSSLKSNLFQVFLSRTQGVHRMLHGPCLSDARGMIDSVVVVSSDAWPHDALPCIHRMFQRGWPSDDVIKKITNDGCLFVPIGSKSSPNKDIEFRMSFSLAEKRLVHSMNSTQFLTYALLKLFLKDVCAQDGDVKDLLCSYFMKTLVFWEIMETKIPWNSTYLLTHFWNCFRRLLRWITNAYCPNFFIPENNMFFEKIHGQNQQNLLFVLGGLYREGYVVLLKIPALSNALEVPRQSCNRGLKRSKVIKKLLSSLCLGYEFSLSEILEVLGPLRCQIISEYFQYLRLSHFNVLCYRNLCEKNKFMCSNKLKYSNEKGLLRIITLSSPDCIRSKMFLSMYFYRCKQYDRCICLLHFVMHNLGDIETIYTYAFDPDKYAALGGDILSVVDGMRKYTASNVPLDSETCIPEIAEECSQPHILTDFHYIPPLVLMHFLFFLCYFRKDDLFEACAHLGKLQNSLNYGSSRCNTIEAKSISWEILGVCHEINGDYQSALESFEKCKVLLSRKKIANINLLRVNRQRIMRIQEFLNIV